MRVSVLAVGLFLLFSQTVPAQHGSGGSSGGGGGSSGGSSGGGSHGSSSGGGSSGGYSGARGSGGSGSSGHRGNASTPSATHGGTSHSASGARTNPANRISLPVDAGAKADLRISQYSTVPGEPSLARNHLLDEALAKIVLEERAVPKTSRSAQTQAHVQIRLPPKPCHWRCGHPAVGHTRNVWHLSEPVYGFIQSTCGDLARRLGGEKDRAESLRAQQQIACSASPLSIGCQSVSRSVTKLDSKVSRLQTKYERCVVSGLRHTRLAASKP